MSPSLHPASRALRLDPVDNVVVAIDALSEGAEVLAIRCAQPIEPGHKLAARQISKGEPVVKFGQIIGFAMETIQTGCHVHVHNCQYAEFERKEQWGVDYHSTQRVAEAERRTFRGIVRANGQVATRNMLAVATTVNCSATVARAIVDKIRHRVLPDYPQIDDVIALTHSGGCGTAERGENIEMLRRTLGGYMQHANIAGVLLLGLGCETNQASGVLAQAGLQPGPSLQVMNIQDVGGSRSALERGVEALSAMMPRANETRRENVSAEHLTVALQCGGSDGYSGITANPALGAAVDLLVAQGGTAILAETPEIYGAEQLLIRRAKNAEVAGKLMERIAWWERHVETTGGSMNNNPSHGNKRGGLTTILEKSLGAIAKGGTTGLMGVYQYAEQVRERGLVFMDSPGNDPYSITGQVASGANLVCFTTGRGSVYGCKPAPCLKLSTNSETFRRMRDDMDFDCGILLEGQMTVQAMGEKIFDRVLAIASGERTKSEEFGFGDSEFLPWRVGAVM